MTYSRLAPEFTFTAERLEQLRAVVPEAFADGRINWESLREALGNYLEDDGAAAEHFGLFWPGKREARKVTTLPSRGGLMPVPGAGLNESETRNLFIEGENLEVLKLLQKSYAGRVKMVYIDPPYNTGNDYVYRDDFTAPLAQYRVVTGQGDEEGKLTTNTRADGRFHSNWLSMMYPRLRLARNLLRDDGFLVVSIDDTEFANLRLLTNELYGDENWLATLVWDRNRKNDARFFSVGHEYMLVYAKSKDYLIDKDIVLRAPKEGVDEVRTQFELLRQEHRGNWEKVRAGLRAYFDSIPEDDPRKPLARFKKVDERGPYRDDADASWPGGGGPRYTVLHPTTGKPCKVPRRGWVFSKKERMDEMIAAGVVVFGPDETFVPKIRTNLFEKTDQVMRSVHYSYAQTAAQQFDSLFGGVRVFDNPKPYQDLAKLVEYLTEAGDLVMDFFAGSASLGHGVIEASMVANQSRDYIVVQFPEPVNEKTESGKNAISLGLKTIADIGKERLRRVINQISAEAQTRTSVKLGFRVFELGPSSFRSWPDPITADVKEVQSLFDQQEEPLVRGWTSDNVLTEVLLMQGFALDSSITDLSDATTNKVKVVSSEFSDHRLLICLDRHIESETLDMLAIEPQDVFVCMDSALSDEAKQQLSDVCTLRTI